MPDYWKKLINCVSCSRRFGKQVYFNTKKDRGSTYFLCSRRKNFSDCSEPILKEKVLLEVIDKHLRIIGGKDFSIEKLKLFVLRIDVHNGETIIRYRDGSTSKISDNELIF
jgi:hypothetical protein